MFKLEGKINSWECCFSFLNRLIPVFPKEEMVLKPREQKLIKIEAPFIDEISGLALIKLLDKLTLECNNVEGQVYTEYSYVRYD